MAGEQEILKQLVIFGNTKGDIYHRREVFWWLVKAIWGGTDKDIQRNPWADQVVLAMNGGRFLGLNGCASSGKSTVPAAWGMLFWWSRPTMTKIMVTSTDRAGARNRIWGQIKEFFTAANLRRGMPGRLIDSAGLILPVDDEGNAMSQRCGIELFAGEVKKAPECIQKWIGIKNQRIILLMDEMPYLGPQLLEAAYGNLMAGCDYFLMVGMGNFFSKLDPFGQFITPKDGWESVNVEDEEWETICNGIPGRCLHFDGSKSPNVVAGKNVYPGIYRVETYQAHVAMGEKSSKYWQMCRSFPSPAGFGNTIFTEVHVDALSAKEPTWSTTPIMLAALDPAFTNGGDAPQFTVGKIGRTMQNRWHLHVVRTEELEVDATDKSTPRDYQVARRFRDRCKHYGVRPEHAALDSTGGGGPFHSIVAHEWNDRVVPINFGGSASEKPANEHDGKSGHEVYQNRVSELWDQGRDYCVKRMISGVPVEIQRDLMAREYADKARYNYAKIMVESKRDLKKRIGRSPDAGDSFVILLELARLSFGFYPDQTVGEPTKVLLEHEREPYHSGLVNLTDLKDVPAKTDEEIREAELFDQGEELDLQGVHGGHHFGSLDW